MSCECTNLFNKLKDRMDQEEKKIFEKSIKSCCSPLNQLIRREEEKKS